ncbi:MAG: hypothetical protein WD740_02760, partial [Anaerolineales bacterium]
LQSLVSFASSLFIHSFRIPTFPLFLNPIQDVFAYVHIRVAHFASVTAEKQSQDQPVSLF